MSGKEIAFGSQVRKIAGSARLLIRAKTLPSIPSVPPKLLPFILHQFRTLSHRFPGLTGGSGPYVCVKLTRCQRFPPWFILVRTDYHPTVPNERKRNFTFSSYPLLNPFHFLCVPIRQLSGKRSVAYLIGLPDGLCREVLSLCDHGYRNTPVCHSSCPKSPKEVGDATYSKRANFNYR